MREDFSSKRLELKKRVVEVSKTFYTKQKLTIGQRRQLNAYERKKFKVKDLNYVNNH